MDDVEIVELLYSHSEDVLNTIQDKYGKLIYTVCAAVLGDSPDTVECVNDTYFKLWNTIPPYRPGHFRSLLCKIARQIAVDRYRSNHKQKSDCGKTVFFCELDEEFPEINASSDAEGLGEEINRFLCGLDVKSRVLFVRRYYFNESGASLADRFNMTEDAVNARLFRVRNKLRKQLVERGYL